MAPSNPTYQRSAADRGELWEALATPAATLRVWHGDRFLEASWDRCASDAMRIAVGLRRRGVGPGTRVPCLLTNSYGSVLSLLGAWLAGGVVTSLPTPGRGESPADYATDLARMIEAAGGDLLLADPAVAPALAEALADRVRVTSPDAVAADGALEPTPPTGADPAFVQYSSGSTSAPKGCVLSARAIVTQITRLGSALGIGDDDRIVSWLPLSHDMGLFGALVMGWMRGADPTIGAPERFLASPSTWLRDCADAQATFTVVPNFALRIAARAAERGLPAERFPLRGCIVGSDRIELSALERAAELLGQCGLTHRTLAPAYGLAEATLAVTATRPGDGPTAISVDAEALLGGEIREAAPGAATTTLVACGTPIDGVRVRIGAAGSDGQLGEICVRSPSLAAGYTGDRARTARTFANGELHTGDFGFIHDGQLYVVGRKDDQITVGGRNIHAGELEAQLGRVPGVRTGRCAVVESIDGDRSRLVALVEPDRSARELRRLGHELRAVVARRTGLGLDELRFLPRGSLPKTPSGKLRRFACRRLAAAPDAPGLARLVFDRRRS